MNDLMWLFALVVFLSIIIFSWASWVGALWLCAKTSGWVELSTDYSRPFPESSTPRTLRRLGLGRRAPLMYNSAIRACILNNTLHLRPTFLAKSSHKPLAIPLEDLIFDTDTTTPHIATLTTFPERKIWFTKDDTAWIKSAKDST